ncbi:AsmA family protein [Thiotrichales bacterium 19X7-9]|nr:AsmA family protein [Thiotrichales bacterium 19X7-9]
MRLIRWIIYTLAALIVLLLIGISIIWFSVDINQYKPQIEKLVKQTTGRTLTLQGDIHWSFSGLDLDIDIGKGKLSNPQGLSGTFAQWDAADIHINPWPTIGYYLGLTDKKVIKINQIIIDRAQAYLNIYTDGKNNLSFSPAQTPSVQSKQIIKNQDSASIDALKTQTPNRELFSKTQWLPILTGAVDIQHATIQYHDQRNNQKLRIYNANLLLESDQNTPSLNLINLTLKTKLLLNQKTFNIHLKSLLAIYPQSINFNNVNATIIAPSNQQEQSLLVSTKKITLSSSTISTGSLKFVVNNLLYITLTDLNFLFKDYSYYGHLALKGENLEDILKSLNINLMTLANPKALNDPSLNADFFGNKQSLLLKNIRGAIGPSNISGNIKLVSFNPIELNYNIDINPFVLSDYLDLKGALLTFNLLHSNGKLTISKDQNQNYLINGENQITSPKALLKGIDLNRIATDVQNLLKSLKTMSGFKDSLNKIKDELQTLNVKDKRINPNNGLTTEIEKINIINQFKGSEVDTNTISLEGNNFYLNGNGEYNLIDKGLNYKLKAFVYNPQSLNLEDYQKVYIPYHIWRKDTDDAIHSTVNYNELFKQVQPIALQGLGKQLSEQLKNNKQLNDKINQFLNNL